MVPPQFDFRRLRHLPMEHVLAARGIHLHRRAGRFVGPCPVHGGDNPNAFVVTVERNLWHCFTRCAGGGDVIELVRRLERCSYRQAAHRLAALARDGTLATPSSPTPQTSTATFQPYTRTLTLDPYCDLLRRKLIRPQTATRFQVGRYHGRGFLAGCVAVRLHDHHGRPLGYAGRRLDTRLARRLGKWKLPPRLPRGRILYNLHRVRSIISRLGVVLVECPWAVMRLDQLRIPAVALLGVHLTAQQARLLSAAHRFLLLLDGDLPGQLASRRICRQLGGTAHTLALPDGIDPDDLSDRQLAALIRPFFPFLF